MVDPGCAGKIHHGVEDAPRLDVDARWTGWKGLGRSPGCRRAGTMARGGWRGKDVAHGSGTPADVRAHVGFSNDVSRLFHVGGAAERLVRRDVVAKGIDLRTSTPFPVTSVDPLDEHGRRYRYPRPPLPRTISPTARETEISRPSWPTMIGRGVQPPIAFLSARGG